MGRMTIAGFGLDMVVLTLTSTLLWIYGLTCILFSDKYKIYRPMGIALFSLIIIIVLFRGKAYYLQGIIPFLLAAGAHASVKNFPVKNYLVSASLNFLIILTSLPALPYALPLLSLENLKKYDTFLGHPSLVPFARWEDGKIHPVSQVYADMTGWEELVSLVNKAYLQVPPGERPECTVYAERNYGFAGAIHFYGRKYGLPEPVTFLESYTLCAPDTISRGPVIYIHYELNGLDKLFSKCEVIGSVKDPFFREKGVKVFLCTGPGDQLQNVYRQKAASEKRVFKNQTRDKKN